MRRSLLLAGLAGLSLLVAACGGGTDSGTLPTVVINSPANGASVPVNEAVSFNVTANDPDGPGVTRVELSIGGTIMDSFEPVGPQNQVQVALNWTPGVEGPVTATVTPYDENGSAGAQATINLTVVGASPVPNSQAEQAPSATTVVVNTRLNIRSGPDPDCPILGSYNNGQQVTIFAQDTTNNWWRVDYNNQAAWISSGFTSAPTGPAVPTESAQGCAPVPSSSGSSTCGNNTCDAGETTATCPADCPAPATCGNGQLDANEGCDPPEAEPPDGAPGEQVCWCDSTCNTQCKVAGPTVSTCGDGVRDVASEACDPPEAEPPDGGPGEQVCWCNDECGFSCKVSGPPVDPCGDGACVPPEDFNSCPADCIQPLVQCGDDICQPSENLITCPADCGNGGVFVGSCGDGTCDPTEGPGTCPADCGNLNVQPSVCGNNVCEGLESLSCPQDCD